MYILLYTLYCGGIDVQKDVIVVGGGASGLVSAIVAARQGRSVTVLEHKDRIGKKILATGNGKCNYTNRFQSQECYRGEDPSFVKPIFEQFGVEETIVFFKELGIYPKEKSGYLYPNSEQASSILDVLRLELDHLKVEIICDEHVSKVEAQKLNSKGLVVYTHNNIYYANKIILATGGTASSELGSDGSGFIIAKKLGHSIIPPVPALVQLRAKEKCFKSLGGIRTQAKILLYIDGNCVDTVQGELQLTNYGVSGIPVFQLSRYAAKGLAANKKVMLNIDFLPDMSDKELKSLIEQRIKTCGYKTVEELMIGLLNKKLSYVLIKEAGVDSNKLSTQLHNKDIDRLVGIIKSFTATIQETNPFSNAQVSAGGVLTEEIHDKTLESKLIKGVYFTGELLDIDGTCGGYNLQWAWSTGYIAGQLL